MEPKQIAIAVAAVVVGFWIVKKLGDKTAAVIEAATPKPAA